MQVVHETLFDHIMYYLEHDCKDEKGLREVGLECKQCLKNKLITYAQFEKIVERGKKRRQEITNERSQPVC